MERIETPITPEFCSDLRARSEAVLADPLPQPEWAKPAAHLYLSLLARVAELEAANDRLRERTALGWEREHACTMAAEAHAVALSTRNAEADALLAEWTAEVVASRQTITTLDKGDMAVALVFMRESGARVDALFDRVAAFLASPSVAREETR